MAVRLVQEKQWYLPAAAPETGACQSGYGVADGEDELALILLTRRSSWE